ncbi:MAG: hypothetical protein N3B21_03590 [Clostridia bacterium]|nr:hypothetical protein [Clostridia bacterium]
MKNNNARALHIITFIIIILGIVVSSIGLLYTTGGKAYDFVNQYGDKVKMYGDGLYAHDSHFVAPIFRGTDFTILCLAIPLLIIALVLDIKRKSLKTRFFLTSVISVFTYYSASISLGVTYNVLHLLYIALFSASLFGLIIAIGSIDRKELVDSIGSKLSYRGFYIFLSFTGVALIAAWLPDIISSLAAGRSLAMIEVYTTSITNVLDMGVVGPTALICLFQLKKRNGIGYILLEILLTLCIIIGVMLPIQSVFQISAGIELPVPVLVTKVASFVTLALFALYFNVKLLRNMKG